MDVHRKWHDMTCVVVYTNSWVNELIHRTCRPGMHNFSKSIGPLKILGSRKVTWSRFYIEDSQISDATVKNLVARRPVAMSFRTPVVMCEAKNKLFQTIQLNT